jgi:hypothetical protein
MARVAGEQNRTLRGAQNTGRAARRVAGHADGKGGAIAEYIHDIPDDTTFVSLSLTGATSVTFNGTAAKFTVVSSWSDPEAAWRTN